jgi:hypothetical protein
MKAPIITILLLPAVIGLAAGTAFAAKGGGSQSAVSQPSGDKGISDRQLKNFAEVRAKLDHIRNQVKARLKTRNTASRRERVFRDGEQAMRKVLQEHHLSASQYRDMATTIRANPELRKKLEAMEPGNE